MPLTFSRDGKTPGEVCYYSVEKLWALTKGTKPRQIHLPNRVLRLSAWEDVRGNSVSPKQVLEDIDNPLYVDHRLRIEHADFTYPVLMNESLTDCYDGLHRLAKAFQLRREYISVVAVSDAVREQTLLECIRPITIHIAGSSGSGKSTLGQRLKESGIAVYDTDEFFQGEQMQESGYEGATDEKKNAIRDLYFKRGFDKAMWDSTDLKLVVFVGLLDHGSPDGTVFQGQRFDHLIFLDVPISALIRRYYGRVCKFLENEEFLKEVSPPGNTRAIPDSDFIYNWHLDTIRKHVDTGYVLKSEEEIESFIKLL